MTSSVEETHLHTPRSAMSARISTRHDHLDQSDECASTSPSIGALSIGVDALHQARRTKPSPLLHRETCRPSSPTRSHHTSPIERNQNRSKTNLPLQIHAWRTTLELSNLAKNSTHSKPRGMLATIVVRPGQFCSDEPHPFHIDFVLVFS